MPPPVFRFAPSPNGYLHLGHAFSALLNFDLARAAAGRFLLRIEDIDPARCRPEFETAIYEDLTWLGIAWEEPVRRQSVHFSEYRDSNYFQAWVWSTRVSKAAPRSQSS
jgi:glutamyl-Q tRNA(Asp) synthetase